MQEGTKNQEICKTDTAPSALPVRTQGIPADLKDLAQWVNWHWKQTRTGWTKVPVNPRTGRPADATDPDTWGPLGAALDNMCRARLPGVGFVFTPDDAYCGVDLDDCRNPQNGDFQGWAMRIIRDIDSYAEVSPSGTGVKIFARGMVPGDRRRKGPIEMYDHARYFTVTGHRVVGTPHAITDAGETMTDLYQNTFGPPTQPNETLVAEVGRLHKGFSLNDEELVLRAAHARNGEKFTGLWNGDRNGYTSSSEADLALCSMLAFWTGPDAGRVDRLFRRSGLCREKWIRRVDYREKTIAEALKRRNFWAPENVSKVYVRSRAVVSLD